MRYGRRKLILLSLVLAAASLLDLRAGEVRLHVSQLPTLPDALGVAAPFAGVAGGELLVAGGANFPQGPPWNGGGKVWHDTIYTLDAPSGQWQSGGKLPRPLGYGVSISARGGLICIGGSDARQHHAECFELKRRDRQLEATSLPPLPIPLAMAAGALIGDTIHVAGGATAPGEQSASSECFALKLKDVSRGWKKLPPCPGAPRILPLAAGVGEDFFLAGGVALVKTNDVIRRVYLRDAWRFRPATGWQRIQDLPQPNAGAPSPAPVMGKEFFVIGGDDGSARHIQPPENHPGFVKSVFAYDTEKDSWRRIGETPAPRVTTSAVEWGGRFVVPSGEVRPAVRSPEVWSYSFTK